MTAARGCPYCHGQAFAPLYAGVRDRLGFAPGEWAFLLCSACGSAVLDPLPDAADLPSFYPPVYSFTTDVGGGVKRRLAALEYAAFFRPMYRAQVRRVIGVCGRGGTLLDAGCGRGLRLLEFRRQGFDVAGVDFQPDAVRYLRESLGVRAEVGGTNDVPRLFPPAAFDVVTAFYLIEHVPDVRAVLADCFAALKPGGWLAAAVPLLDSAQAELFGRRWIHVTEAPRHLSLPTRAALHAAATAVGFADVCFRPDAVLNAAGPVASSLITGATLTHAYGGGKWKAMAARVFGGVVTLAALPLCGLENAVGRMSHGILFARKPPS